MDPQKQTTIKSSLILLLLTIFGGVVAIALYEHVVRPGYQLMPLVPELLYEFSKVFIGLVYLCGFVVIVLSSVSGIRKYLIYRERRSAVHEQIRRWPNSKWDLLPIIAGTWFAAAMAFAMVMVLLLPRGSLAGVMSIEQALILMLVAFGPPFFIYFPVLIREIYREFRDVIGQWPSRTRREKVAYAVVMSFVLIAWVVVTAGDLAG